MARPYSQSLNEAIAPPIPIHVRTPINIMPEFVALVAKPLNSLLMHAILMSGLTCASYSPRWGVGPRTVLSSDSKSNFQNERALMALDLWRLHVTCGQQIRPDEEEGTDP